MDERFPAPPRAAAPARANDTPLSPEVKDSAAPRLAWTLLAVGAVLAGVALRLLWVQDMEYKYDEAYMFERSQRVGVDEPWPAVGMESGAGTRNPGLSIWFFVGLARLFGAYEPVALTRAVIVLNVMALGGLAAFVYGSVRSEDREPWWWALALASVNPLAIQLQRKIWAQSVLPLLCVVTLVGWWHRSRAWGAFLWGSVGSLLGQIHMSGFFLFGGFALWAALFDRARVRWGAWLGGVALGALPLLPWVAYLVDPTDPASGSRSWKELVRMRFWSNWLGESTGFHLGRSLGSEAFRDFLGFPLVAGRATHVVGGLHAVLLVAALTALGLGFRSLWRRRRSWRELWIGRESETAFTQNAALWGCGLLITLAQVGVARHYLIVTFPLMFLWLARMGLSDPRVGRRALLTLAIAQLLTSGAFLSYVHVRGGAPDGDYGVSYRQQLHDAQD